ncbi:UDP-N-acetylmuramoyl-L-alanine--D-glutamate ligase [Thiovibrio sp. JS02]
MGKNVKEMLRKGAHVVVVGLGASGVSAVRFLLGLGVKISVSEGGRQENLEGDLVRWLKENGVYVETGGHTSELFTSADCILVSPGVPLDIPALASARGEGIPVIGELALAKDFLRTPLVAITGTNGKSTVTTLIGDLIAADRKKVFVGGNIGVPLTDYLAGGQDCEAAVLEVSSYQLDGAGEFRPWVGVLLNITPDHLDRYASYDDYAAAKLSLFRHQQEGDVAVVNGDDALVGAWLGKVKEGKAPWPVRARLHVYGRNKKDGLRAWLQGKIAVIAPDGREKSDCEEYDLAGTPLAHAPNDENALAAILAARAMGVSREAIAGALACFQPLAHRLAFVAELAGVRYYDDSKATNVGAVHSALAGIQAPVVLIAGGRDKGGSYEMLVPQVKEKVRALVLIGEAKEKIAEAFAGLSRIVFAADMEEAVHLASSMARQGDVVLLSPACASFDMFKSYRHRGEVFCQAVQKLAGTGR